MSDINATIEQVIGYDRLALIDKVAALHDEARKKKAEADHLEKVESIIQSREHELARAHLKSQDERVSEERCKTLARASDAYSQACHNTLCARLEHAELEAEYYRLRNQWEDSSDKLSFAQSQMRMETHR